MHLPRRLSFFPTLLASFALLLPGVRAQTPAADKSDAKPYTATAPSPDGTGKVYMGREISHVMGHQGASWLDRPEREEEERIDVLVSELRRRLKPDAVVADIGAGSGYISLQIAPLVPRGKVLAEDIDTDMLKIIARKKAAAPGTAADRVQTVLGTTTDTKLPADSVDCVVLVDTYHEWDYPREMMASILKALKPSGQLVQLEYREEDPTVQILPHHKMSEVQARKEMEAAGLRWVETRRTLPQQHLLIYEKSGK